MAGHVVGFFRPLARVENRLDHPSADAPSLVRNPIIVLPFLTTINVANLDAPPRSKRICRANRTSCSFSELNLIITKPPKLTKSREPWKLAIFTPTHSEEMTIPPKLRLIKERL